MDLVGEIHWGDTGPLEVNWSDGDRLEMRLI